MTRVDNDDVIAHIEKRRVSRVIFTRQNSRYFGRQTPDEYRPPAVSLLAQQPIHLGAREDPGEEIG